MIAIFFVLPTITLVGQSVRAPAGFIVHRDEQRNLSFIYPEEWFVTELRETVVIVSREELVEEIQRVELRMRPGDAALSLAILPIGMLEAMGMEISQAEPMVELLFDSMLARPAIRVLADTEVTQSGRSEVASILFSDDEQPYAGLMYVAMVSEDPSGVTLGLATGFREDLVEIRERLGRIVASVEPIRGAPSAENERDDG